MKKILLLFAATGLLTLTGCNNNDDDVVVDTRNESFQVGPISFTNTTDSYFYNLNPVIGSNDVLLIYRLTSDPQGTDDVWEPVPSTYKFDNDEELNYNTDFSASSIGFYLSANFDLTTVPNYALNQWFKVVILKNYDNSANRVDLRDYNAVVRMFNVVETNRGNSTSRR